MTDNTHNFAEHPDYSGFEMHLSRQQVDRVCHYTHWIPNTRGFTQRFFDEHYPGWDLSTFMRVFKAAAILVKDGVGSPLAGRCHWQVCTLHFSRNGDFAVEWDESLPDDGKYFWSGAAEAKGRGALNAEVSTRDLESDEGVSRLVDEILDELGSTRAE